MEQNSDIESFQSMEIVWIGWRAKLTKDQEYATMVIEITDPVIGNAILDEHLMVGEANKSPFSLQQGMQIHTVLQMLPSRAHNDSML